MEELIDKIAYLFWPKNFKVVFGYCFYYWIIMTQSSLFYRWTMLDRVSTTNAYSTRIPLLEPKMTLNERLLELDMTLFGRIC